MIIDFIGAVLRYLFSNISNKIRGNDFITLSEFFDDKNQKIADKMDNSSVDTIIGGIFLVAILVLIYILS